IDSRTVLYVAPDDEGLGPWLWALDVERKVTRRVLPGLERYVSIAANANGRKLIASVSTSTATLWSVPILDRLVEERDVRPYQLGSSRALAPRFGGSSLFYLSSSGAGDGLWRVQAGSAQAGTPVEVWKDSDGPVLEAPAVSPQGDWAAIVVRRDGKLRLT